MAFKLDLFSMQKSKPKLVKFMEHLSTLPSSLKIPLFENLSGKCLVLTQNISNLKITANKAFFPQQLALNEVYICNGTLRVTRRAPRGAPFTWRAPRGTIKCTNSKRSFKNILLYSLYWGLKTFHR